MIKLLKTNPNWEPNINILSSDNTTLFLQYKVNSRMRTIKGGCLVFFSTPKSVLEKLSGRKSKSNPAKEVGLKGCNRLFGEVSRLK